MRRQLHAINFKISTLCSVVAAAVMAASSLLFPMAVASAASPLTLIVIGGNSDPTSAQAIATMQQLGWIPAGAQVIPINYNANVFNTDAAIADGAPKIVAAYNQYCQGVNPCELHGVSLGSTVLAAAEDQLPVPNANTRVVLHNSPVPDTGIYHSLAPSNPLFQPILSTLGVFPSQTPVAPAGTEHWYNQDDPYANSAPQCYNAAAISSMLPLYEPGGSHNITPPSGATYVWTGPDGVINHEFDTFHNPFSVSGNSWFKPTCPPKWYR